MRLIKRNAKVRDMDASTVSKQKGMSLVEVMLSMFILALLSIGLTKALTQAKYIAEDNLYEATALTVALSTIEQMKGAAITLLSNPAVDANGIKTFDLVVGGNQIVTLKLGNENILSVPIITEDNGNITKTLSLKVTPKIEANASGTAYWTEIVYSWDHPSTGRTRSDVVRNLRSTVETF